MRILTGLDQYIDSPSPKDVLLLKPDELDEYNEYVSEGDLPSAQSVYRVSIKDLDRYLFILKYHVSLMEGLDYNVYVDDSNEAALIATWESFIIALKKCDLPAVQYGLEKLKEYEFPVFLSNLNIFLDFVSQYLSNLFKPLIDGSLFTPTGRIVSLTDAGRVKIEGSTVITGFLKRHRGVLSSKSDFSEQFQIYCASLRRLIDETNNAVRSERYYFYSAYSYFLGKYHLAIGDYNQCLLFLNRTLDFYFLYLLDENGKIRTVTGELAYPDGDIMIGPKKSYNLLKDCELIYPTESITSLVSYVYELRNKSILVHGANFVSDEIDSYFSKAFEGIKQIEGSKRWSSMVGTFYKSSFFNLNMLFELEPSFDVACAKVD